MKIKLIATLLCVMFFCGCDRNETNKLQANSINNDITYFKDQRTGICFACFMQGYSGGIATVPCDSIPDYLLIKKDQK